jgi:hypothetical protein
VARLRHTLWVSRSFPERTSGRWPLVLGDNAVDHEPHSQSAPSRRPWPPALERQVYCHPLAFYAFATAIPWGIVVDGAAWLSRQPVQGSAQMATMTGLGLAGLAAPVVVAAWFIRRPSTNGQVNGYRQPTIRGAVVAGIRPEAHHRTAPFRRQC